MVKFRQMKNIKSMLEKYRLFSNSNKSKQVAPDNLSKVKNLNLTNIISILKKYWVFVVLIVIGLGLLIIRFTTQEDRPDLQSLPETQTTLMKPIIDGLPLPSNVSFKIESFPEIAQAEIYQGKEIIFSSEKAKLVGSKLGFSQDPQITDDVFLGKFRLWNENNYSLSISLSPGTIDYSLDLYKASIPTSNQLPSPEKTRTKLETLLKDLEISPLPEISWQKEEYLIKGFYFKTVSSPNDANFIKSGFNPTIGDYQLVGPNPYEPLVSLILDREENIVKLFFQSYFSDFEKKEAFPLKNEKDIKLTLKTDGKIVYYDTLKTSIAVPEFKSVSLEQVRLAYFQEMKRNLTVQPIYILNGTGTLKDGKKTAVIVYLPAVSSDKLGTSREHFDIQKLEENLNFNPNELK
jgi:hypothetical protein